MAPGAVGAIVGLRRSQAYQADAGPVGCSDLPEMVKAREQGEILQKYGKKKPGRLQRDELKLLLTDLDDHSPPGTVPTDEELDFVMKVADRACNGVINASELEDAMGVWQIYISMRPKMEEAIRKFAQSGKGKLGQSQLKAYLEDLNEGRPVTNSDLEKIFNEADVFGNGALGQTELSKATAAWQAIVEKKKSSVCIVL
eukprot:gnl/MRDRNA2_/MRDRNA2_126248_c0_seq1.p1 gnl/MRDRNA2_/MRDRNA2_126248_c0~~gnl/MRDRNA2_/MRDRNA2_126248_c0_seq1.p1  ORF type:complete len:199 (+),score=42.36 gnl/MRDRNA2_/MRDRNA2_126248_c0_seq1:73-669(+)